MLAIEAKMMKMVYFTLVISTFSSPAMSLQCYQCSNMETDMKSDLFEEFKKESNPDCDSASYTSLSTVTCPNGHLCALVKAKVTGKFAFGTEVEVNAQIRDCMLPDTSYTTNGCDKNINTVDKLGNSAIKMFSELSNVRVDGKVCYCDFPNCLPGGCGDGEVEISGECVAWYIIAASVACMVLVITLITCCCCCCCCSCFRNSHPRGQVIAVTVPSQSLVVPISSGGVHGITNPGYEQNYRAPVEMLTVPYIAQDNGQSMA